MGEEIEVLIIPNNCGNCNRCPDFDEDCSLVTDHLACFIGNEITDGIAKGYCPFIHSEQ